MQLIRSVINQTCFSFALILFVVMGHSLEASESAHEHGVGSISFAVEGNDVEIELTIPGSDVVGFEHLPSTADERQAVIMGVRSLRNIKGIVTLPSEAKCRAEDVEVTSGLLENQKDDHGHSDKHKHEEKKEDNNKEVHSEFIAHYHFHCEYPKLMNSVQLGFFKAFPSAHELDAKWITPKGQGASELTPNSPNLTF